MISLYYFNKFFSLRYSDWQYSLNEHQIIKVTGKDRDSFFHGQCTADIKKISNDSFVLCSRLNNQAKVQYYFYYLKSDQEAFVLVHQNFSELLLTDLNKFIIMDDVELSSSSHQVYFVHSKQKLELNTAIDVKIFDGLMFGLEGSIYISESINEAVTFNLSKEWQGLAQKDPSEIEEICTLNGWPFFNPAQDVQKFIHETTLNLWSISYQKGCYLGQETAQKIQNNRGAQLAPYLIMDNDQHLHPVYLERIDRVVGKKIQLTSGLSGIVTDYPYFKNITKKEKADEILYFASLAFQAEEWEKALCMIQLSIDLYPSEDALEMQGVLLGRLERFDEAIKSMDLLEELNPQSVMASTNKSMFYMKLGQIELAEVEKSKATVKSFAKFGEEAKEKKAIEALKAREEAEELEREKMFNQVLEIDPDDTIALNGMGSLALKRKDFSAARSYLEKVVALDPKYSVAYLNLAKSLIELKDMECAQITLQKGIERASLKGDLMPAQEMQSLYNKFF